MSEISNTNELPDDWENTTLVKISSYIQRGKSPKYIDHSELAVINQKCIRWNGIDRTHSKYIHPEQFDKFTEERFLKNGDILWNSTGTGTIGRAAIVTLKENEKLVADSHVTIVRAKNNIEPKYVHYWIMSPKVQNSIEDMQSGSTNQVELSKKAVESTPIPLAPIYKQKQIVAKIEELFSHIDSGVVALQKAKHLLKQYRQSVLKAAVTGELTKEWREHNQDKLEPASELLKRILDERRRKWEEQQIEQFKAQGKVPKDDKWKEKYRKAKQAAVFNNLKYPDEWELASIDQVAEVLLGKMLDKSKHTTGELLPYLRNINVRWGKVDTDDLLQMYFKFSELDRYGVMYWSVREVSLVELLYGQRIMFQCNTKKQCTE